MAQQQILSVGQCLADHGGIRWSLQAHFPDVKLVGVATREEVLEHLQKEPVDLILVNRVFDANGDSGNDLIEQLKQDEQFAGLPVMLVSNYEDAQERAVELGALPGFGKSSLGQSAMINAIEAALAK